NVREDVAVHELAVSQAGANAPPLAPGVAQANRGEPGVAADAEHVEVERRGDVPLLGRQHALDPETALSRAQIEMVVVAEFTRERWQLRWPVDVVPIRVVPLEVHDRIRLAEPRSED